MKKVFILISILVISLVLTGCNGDVTRSLRQDGFSVNDSKFKCNLLNLDGKEAKDENTSENIKFLVGDYAIGESGNIYQLSYDKLFSNDMNCKKVAKIPTKAVFDESYILGEDGKYYYLNAQDGDTVVQFSEVPQEDENYQKLSLFFTGDVKKAVTVNSNINSYYVLKDDGSIYNYVLTKDEQSKTFFVKSDNVQFTSNSYDGKIIDFYYAGDSTTTFFRTPTSIYRNLIGNEEECSKYVDVPCEYEIGVDTTLTENLDRIVIYNGKKLFTDYGRIFTLES